MYNREKLNKQLEKEEKKTLLMFYYLNRFLIRCEVIRDYLILVADEESVDSVSGGGVFVVCRSLRPQGDTRYHAVICVDD